MGPLLSPYHLVFAHRNHSRGTHGSWVTLFSNADTMTPSAGTEHGARPVGLGACGS
jgi:hypothetical protein